MLIHTRKGKVAKARVRRNAIRTLSCSVIGGMSAIGNKRTLTKLDQVQDFIGIDHGEARALRHEGVVQPHGCRQSAELTPAVAERTDLDHSLVLSHEEQVR